ncbi:NRDE family protein [Halovivax limisalsi]|uniref:NRDE family protein n=1 Tax=Halovivax limisalsi TaxID=1453760 RepID=UPI001FFC9E44|nr:NRDE family protein [Halovivax limisalsi]
MCTLALAWQVFPDAPVVVAANRDEALDRPADPPGRFADDPRVVAPRDRDAGGTWIGINERDVLVAITNRWTDATLAGERSRGLLVADALSRRTASAAATAVDSACASDEYGGFYLVIADASDAYVLGWNGRLDRRQLDPGVHVVTNVGPVDAPVLPSSRVGPARKQLDQGRRVRDALGSEVDGGSDSADTGSESAPRTSDRGDRSAGDVDAWLDRAEAVLSDHAYGVCRHGDGFGTRSSSLIALGERPHYRYAPGPPCRTAFEPVDLESHI